MEQSMSSYQEQLDKDSMWGNVNLLMITIGHVKISHKSTMSEISLIGLAEKIIPRNYWKAVKMSLF